MRQAYGLTSWVPETVLENIKDVQVDRERGAIILTLHSGTRIMDRHDRVDVVGAVDDVAVAELVEVVRRKGWDAVEVRGEPGFRRAVAFRLALLEPPVVIANSPLGEAEQAEIERIRQTRAAVPGPARALTIQPGMR